MVAEEERKISPGPTARVSDLLKKVFGIPNVRPRSPLHDGKIFLREFLGFIPRGRMC